MVSSLLTAEYKYVVENVYRKTTQFKSESPQSFTAAINILASVLVMLFIEKNTNSWDQRAILVSLLFQL